MNQKLDHQLGYYCSETFQKYTATKAHRLSFLCICCRQARRLIVDESVNIISDTWTNYAAWAN